MRQVAIPFSLLEKRAEPTYNDRRDIEVFYSESHSERSNDHSGAIGSRISIDLKFPETQR